MAASAEPAQVQALQCMEIWGGNQATDRAVSTPGLDLWVYSRPHEGAEGDSDFERAMVRHPLADTVRA